MATNEWISKAEDLADKVTDCQRGVVIVSYFTGFTTLSSFAWVLLVVLFGVHGDEISWYVS